jgi:hypothetical protein
MQPDEPMDNLTIAFQCQNFQNHFLFYTKLKAYLLMLLQWSGTKLYTQKNKSLYPYVSKK